MQQYKIPARLLNHFGLNKGTGTYWSETCDDRKEYIKESIDEQQMLAIVGDVGVGKSTLFDIVKKEMGATTEFIYCEDPNKEYMHVGSILTDAISHFSGGTIRRVRSARKIQFTRIIGSAHVTGKKNICIVIEEAHRLNPKLFRAIKELREAEYLGVSPLFSIVMLGHEHLKFKLESMKEAFYRSHILELSEAAGWLNYDERVEFLRVVFGRAIKPTVRKRIATMKRFPLEMVHYVEQKMMEAYQAGEDVLDDKIVKPTPIEMYHAMKASYPEAISYKIIADEINLDSNKYIGKSSISDILNTPGHSKAGAVSKAMEKIAERQEKEFLSNAKKVG